jgi:hypothetical protein
MMPDPGSAKISRSGPGDETTPSPTAAIRSSNPMIFQIHTVEWAAAPFL